VRFFMTAQIPILAYTCSAYCKAIRERLGRGEQHAAILYRQFCQKGALKDDPAFNNAPLLREEICNNTNFSQMQVVEELSDEGTTKFCLSTEDNKLIETVFIPMKKRGTLCVSSQVGCTQGCAFCETAKMGLIRNLTTEEIVSQLFIAKFEKNLPINNVVFMGMGEPFDNIEHVLAAARVISDPKGFAIGCNHITISTSGMVPGIERLSKEQELPINLALSLNAPNDAMRTRLMPITKRYNMESLKAAIANYNQVTGREVMIAYVLLADVNDSLDNADALADYLQGLNVRVNLIAYNPGKRGPFKRPLDETVESFKKSLQSHGLQALVRPSRGERIDAGCGQLSSKRHLGLKN